MSYRSAIRETLREEMQRDPRIVLMGEDIGTYGGAYKVTDGLLAEFGPSRVIDTPISESGIVGVGLGMALKGMRPVVELMFMDFLQLGMEQFVTEAAKARFLSAGKLSAPLLLRMPYGMGRALGPQHSQFFPSWFLQVPGISVVLPSTPEDARGLLRTALSASHPVLFIESAALYNNSGAVPEGPFSTEFGSARVHRTGKDITIVAVSRVLPEALKAAEELSQKGIEAEVLDPRTLKPLDEKTLVSSVRKTRRILIASDDYRYGGVGAAVLSAVAGEIFRGLEAPPAILGPPDYPPPANQGLEREYLVSHAQIADIAISQFKNP